MIAAVVGGVVGGLINTAVHWDDITRGGFNWGKAGVAFGIGAAAGAMAGLTGGASLSTMPVATSAATLAGQTAISSVMAYGVSSPIQNIGNHIAFGDPLASPRDVLNGLAMSAATGAATGLISGLAFQRLPLFDPAPSGLVKQVGYISNIADDAEAAATYFEAHPQELEPVVVTASRTPGNYSVYNGIDNAGNVRYVGITTQEPQVRFSQHISNIGTGKEFLQYRLVDGANNLSRINARVWEQNLINQHGLQRNGGLLLNKINSISPKFWPKYGIMP